MSGRKRWMTWLTLSACCVFAGSCGLIDAAAGALEPDTPSPGVVEPESETEDCPPDEHDDGTGACVAEGDCADDFSLATSGGYCIRVEALADLPGSPVAFHSATLVDSQTVLAVGGYDVQAQNTDDAQILRYSIPDDQWERVGFLSRFGHVAVSAAEGTHIIGGARDTATTVATVTTVTLNDGGNATVADLIPPLPEPREGHTVSVLSGGRLVVIGGGVALGAPTPSIAVFDGDAWSTLASPLPWAPAYHATTVLDDGRLLVTGGAAEVNFIGPVSDQAAVVDVDAGTVTARDPMGAARAEHTATLLPDGSVLIVGGRDGNGLPTSSTELYSGTTFRLFDPAALPQSRMSHQAVHLSGGDLLLTGGTMDTGANFFPATRLTLIAQNGAVHDLVDTPVGRSAHPLIKLSDRSVLLVGGGGPNGFEDAATSSVYRVTVGR